VSSITTPPIAGGHLNVDEAVRHRYSRAAVETEQQLCCPVTYDPKLLDVLPIEILERDYGCGDPSKYVCEGEVVLDLGAGAGKICYIAAQIVGESGKVLGVDCNDDMLALARKHQSSVAKKLGYANVEFRKGKIQDLQLDLELLDDYLAENPVGNSGEFLKLQEHSLQLRQKSPLISDDSIDVVISNCVLNLVHSEDRNQLFREVFRVLKRGGRAVIADIVSDEAVPLRLQGDADLWSGCISGAFREDRLLAAFEDAGFYGIEIVARESEPWAVVEGIEFRSLTVQAFKGKQGECLERNQAVIYNGPWKAVLDDDGHKLLRGQRMAVCDKAFKIYTRAPYQGQITAVPPHQLVPVEEAKEFPCSGPATRAARVTKGDTGDLTILPEGDCCGPGQC